MKGNGGRVENGRAGARGRGSRIYGMCHRLTMIPIFFLSLAQMPAAAGIYGRLHLPDKKGSPPEVKCLAKAVIHMRHPAQRLSAVSMREEVLGTFPLYHQR